MSLEDFDAITRELGTARTRRGALKLLAGAVCAGIYGRLRPTAAAAAGRTIIASASAALLCPHDRITTKSLSAARTKLAHGANRVKMSPKGCAQYARTRKGGKLQHEVVTVSGRKVLEWQHSATQSSGKRDTDLDGFFESRSTVNRSSHGASRRQDTTYSPTTKRPLSRQTYTAGPSGITVQVEVADSSGQLQTITTFTTDAASFQEAVSAAVGEGEPHGRVAASVCTNAQNSLLMSRMQHALNVGYACFQHYQSDQELDVGLAIIARDLAFTCSYTHCAAQLDPKSFMDPLTPLTVHVDIDCFLKQTEETQTGVLWHEFLHSLFGPHGKGTKGLPRYKELDRVEACESLCTGNAPITKCSCARCLGTNKCDKRCRSHTDCDPALGFICPCPTGPNAFKWFATCTKCLATCPSGLSCFGFSTCQVVNVACGTPTTCP